MATESTTIDIDMLLEGVQKPGRYIGAEVNSIVKEHRADMVTFAFVFPDLYEIGMSHVGLQILYSLLNKNDDFVCERVFAPALDMEARLRETKSPLFSLETRTPLKQFDIIGFSLQYELHYTEVLAMLELAQLPVRSSERASDDPLVFAGGPCVVNPEPMAEFIDVFIIGDGELILPELFALYQKIKREYPSGERKEIFLDKIKDKRGVYIPSLYSVRGNRPVMKSLINKAIVKDLDAIEYPTKPIIPYIRTVHNRANVEVMRGCPRQCKFCQARTVYWPVRRRKTETVKALSQEIIANTGYNEISLQSLSIGDYPGIEDVLLDLTNGLAEEKVSVSFPSLRVEKILKILTDYSSLVRKTGLTFALEAGSQELRDSIKKDIDIAVFFKALENVFKSNNDTVKLYFMIGLPGETREDVEGIVSVVEQILAMVRTAKKKRFHINLGVSTFVPKPHTDLECEKLSTEEDIKAKQDLLKSALYPIKKVKLSLTDYSITLIEGLLSRGDRTIGAVIERAWKKGARLDGWIEHFNAELWRSVIESADYAQYLYTSFDDRDQLPWSFIECRPSQQ